MNSTSEFFFLQRTEKNNNIPNSFHGAQIMTQKLAKVFLKRKVIDSPCVYTCKCPKQNPSMLELINKRIYHDHIEFTSVFHSGVLLETFQMLSTILID